MSELNGKQVLIVEDEMLLALDLEDILAAAGCKVVGPAMRLETALSLAADAAIDLAVLDINLHGARSYPVADILMDRGIPFLFASGYGHAEDVTRYGDIMTLSKPYSPDQIQDALRQLNGRSSAPLQNSMTSH